MLSARLVPSAPERTWQKGQVIILMAIYLVAMVAMVGLAVDGGRVYLAYRGLQNASDAGALAGADTLSHNSSSTARQTAMSYVTTDLPGTTAPGGIYGSDFSNVDIGAGYKVSMSITPVGGQSTFTVTVSQNLRTTFITAVGINQVTVQTSATALVGTSGFNGAILATAPCGTNPYGINVTGGTNVLINGGIQSNGSVNVNNPSNITVNGNAYAHCSFSGTPTFTGGGAAYASSPVVSDPGYPEPSPLPTTSYGGVNYSGSSSDPAELKPGKYVQMQISNGCYFADPGIYEWGGSFPAGFAQSGGFVTNRLAPPGTGDLWATAGCSVGAISATATSTGTLLPSGTYALEVTSTRTDGGILRESTTSSCITITLTTPHSITVSVPNVAGAQGYNLYSSPTGCTGSFSRVAQGTVTAVEKQGALGVTTILYQLGSAGGPPPSGDQANEAYLVGSITPGAVSFVTDPTSYVTITGGSGSILFSGKQYNWMIVWNNPANNTNQCASTITGGSMTHLIGIFYSPQCQVSITGGSGTSLDGQLVAYNVVITGGSGTAVNFNAGYLPRVAARITQ